MARLEPTNHHIAANGVFRSQALPDFLKRMNELEEVLDGRVALATLEFFDESLARPDEPSPREFVNEVRQYRRSRPIRRFNYHAINKAAIVLLSACLEGFIEKLHAEVMRQLLNERRRSRGVLNNLVTYAHRRYGNPSPNKIRGLFKICGISNTVSKVRQKELERFVKLRNIIAHGGKMPEPSKDAEDWVEVIRRFVDELNALVEEAVNARK